MNLTLIGAIIIVGLLAGVGVTGKLLLNAHDKIGEQAVVIRDKQAEIDQNKRDAELSAKLDAYQQKVEALLKINTQKTTQAINDATNDDDAASAAIAGVMRTRATAAQRGGAP